MSQLDSYYKLGKSPRFSPLKWLGGIWQGGKFRWGRFLLALMGLGILGVVTLVLMVRFGVFGKLPSEAALRGIQHYTASEIYAADGEVLGKYYVENRTNLSFGEVPSHLVEALVATEDARFFEHGGIDVRSLARVGVKTLLLQDRSSGGGSTITQQLAKNLFPRENWWMGSTVIAKIKEMLIARRLEAAYVDKRAILTLYLNTVPFGEKVFGLSAASRRFFNTVPQKLRPEESAVLVGMLKATSYYNPHNHPERATERRNVVLNQMVKYGYLQPQAADSLKGISLETKYVRLSASHGPAPYFRQAAGQYLKEWLNDYNDAHGTDYNLFTGGLRIYTTIDARMQQYAEEAIAEHMPGLQAGFDKHWEKRTLWKEKDAAIQRAIKQSRRYQGLKAQGLSDVAIQANFQKAIPMRVWTWEGYKELEMSPLDSIIHYQSFLHAGMLAMEPQSGHVRAWVGGINYRIFQYDHVTSRRQVGSTFKPIIYSGALEQGFDPCTYISNEKVSYAAYKGWTPGNADGKYGGFYSLKGGLVNSVNTVSAAIMDRMGVEEAATFAERFGFTSSIPHEASLVLGTADLTVRDMVGAYSTFVNRGMRKRPVVITRIEDSQGNLLGEWPEKPQRVQVMSEESATMMLDMLEAVVDSGTARRLRYKYGIRTELAGKTGTTQNQTDGWFMGLTPGLVVGVWVGGDDRKVRFRSLSLGQGASTALPIFARFIKKVYRDRKYRALRNASFPIADMGALRRMECPMYSETGLDPTKPNVIMLLEHLRQQSEARKAARQGRDSTRKQKQKGDRWDWLFRQRKNQDGG